MEASGVLNQMPVPAPCFQGSGLNFVSVTVQRKIVFGKAPFPRHFQSPAFKKGIFPVNKQGILNRKNAFLQIIEIEG